MDWIEIVLTLVFIVLGALGGRRKQQRQAPKTSPEQADLPEFSQEDDDRSPEQWLQEIMEGLSATVPPKQEDPVVVQPPVEPLRPQSQPQSRPARPLRPEQEPKSEEQATWNREEKRKLILYSEIMKPKFEES